MVRLQAGNIADLCRALSINLLEVGTSNKTGADDYSPALQESPAKSALLTVHSPFVQIQGFSDRPENQEMVQIAQKHNSPRLLILDGALPTSPEGLCFRPDLCIDRSISDGFDIIIVNGYGLLGLTEGALVIGQGKWGEIMQSQRIAEGAGIWLAGAELTSMVSAQLANYCRRGWERLHPAISLIHQDEKKEKSKAMKLAKLLRPFWGELKAQRIMGFCLGEMRPGWAVELTITDQVRSHLHHQGVYYLSDGNQAIFFTRALTGQQMGKLTHILSETAK
jgi:seryl-tRNA(Sec) selenium transferase